MVSFITGMFKKRAGVYCEDFFEIVASSNFTANMEAGILNMFWETTSYCAFLTQNDKYYMLIKLPYKTRA